MKFTSLTVFKYTICGVEYSQCMLTNSSLSFSLSPIESQYPLNTPASTLPAPGDHHCT